jgi:hypothetical protein
MAITSAGIAIFFLSVKLTGLLLMRGQATGGLWFEPMP